MSERPLSTEVKEALAACDDLRMMGGPLMSDLADKHLDKIETTLRHLLHALIGETHVKRHP
jgi:hypothetical protein